MSTITPGQLGIELYQNEKGHWIAKHKEEIVAGPYFNKPAFCKMMSKGELRTMVIQNPQSDDPNYYILW